MNKQADQLWKHKSKKTFNTPQALWEAAQKYFAWCDANPIHNGKFSNIRPYTIAGLCLYLHVNRAYFRTFEHQNKDDKDYIEVIGLIKDAIYDQQFSGAAAGYLNPMIIARALSLGEKTQTDITFKGDVNIIKLPDGTEIDI